MEFDLLGSLDPSRSQHDAARTGAACAAEHPVCSRRGCSSPAVWSLLWNNPRIHTPQRRKTWLACDEHREHLVDFLDQRGFLRSVVPFEASSETGPEFLPGAGCEPGSAPGGRVAGRHE